MIRQTNIAPTLALVGAPLAASSPPVALSMQVDILWALSVPRSREDDEILRGLAFRWGVR